MIQNRDINFNILNSSSFPDIEGSIDHSKYNKITLDNISTFYIFEDQLIFGFSILRKYENIFKTNMLRYKIKEEHKLRPEYVSYELYGTTDFWYMLLFLNDMMSTDEFIKDEINIFNSAFIDQLFKILENERKVINNMDNPKKVKKHILRSLDSPSKRVLPKDYNDKIDHESIPKHYEEDNIHFKEDNLYTEYSSFLKGKINKYVYSINPDLEYDTDPVLIDKTIIDGFKLDNDNNVGYPSNYMNNTRRIFDGLMLFNKSGKYKFKPVVIGNGTFYLDDKKIFDFTNPFNYQYTIDYFEKATLNSDFKKRNFDGWEVLDNRGKLIWDDVLKKNVFNINLIDNPTSLEFLKVTLDGKDIPSGDDIIFQARFKTIGGRNFLFDGGIVDVTYVDGTKDSISHNMNNISFSNTVDYAEHAIVLSNNEQKKIKNVIIRFIANKKDIPLSTMDCSIFIDDISIRSDRFNSFDIEVNDKNWHSIKLEYNTIKDQPSLLSMYWSQPNETKFSTISSQYIGFIPYDMNRVGYMVSNKLYNVEKNNFINEFITSDLNTIMSDNNPSIYLPEKSSYSIEKQCYTLLEKGKDYRLHGAINDVITIYRDDKLWMTKPKGSLYSNVFKMADNSKEYLIRMEGTHTYGNGDAIFYLEVNPDNLGNPKWSLGHPSNFIFDPKIMETQWKRNTKKLFIGNTFVRSFTKLYNKNFDGLTDDFILDFDIQIEKPLMFGFGSIMFNIQNKNQYYLLIFKRKDTNPIIDADKISLDSGLYKVDPRYPYVNLLKSGNLESFGLNCKKIESIDLELINNTKTTLKLIRYKNRIRLYRNGDMVNPLLNLRDNDNIFIGGSIGFQSMYQTYLSFSNITLWQ